MKKQLQTQLLVLSLILGTLFSITAQEIVPLSQRVSKSNIHGDLTMIGNSIVGLAYSNDENVAYNPNEAYNGNLNNGNSISEYIDIDSDATTFSSSSADLATPRPDCTTIAYAGLYWSATYYLDRTPIYTPRLTVNNTTIAGDYVIADNAFNPGHIDIPSAPGLTANLVLAEDNVSDANDGCQALVNAAEMNGNIAVLRRGNCGFTEKVINAQNAGAVAVIMVNNTAGVFSIGGGDANISIPTVTISQQDGEAIITEMANATVNVTLINDADTTIGNEQLVNLPVADARKQGAADFRNIKFKAPGSTYVDVTAQSIIYDGYANTPTNQTRDVNDIDGDGNTTEFIASDDVPYVCYADVTDLISQDNVTGTYTVANMNATIGSTSGVSGPAGGWTLVIIYEDPQATAKVIDTNDGFIQINNAEPPVDFMYNGFTTVPAPLPVNARFGISALEGDKTLVGDRLLIQDVNGNYVSLGSGFDVSEINPTTNFFNSSISFNNQHTTNRNPASQNTLGYDIDVFDLPNANNTLIGNDQRLANFRLQTDQDSYRVFLTSFSTEIIEPELRIINRVYDIDGITDITNATVELGDELFYDLEIENVGNEDLIDGTIRIRDILPANVDLISIQDATLPTGVTYDITIPGVIDFNIPADLVEENDAPIFIRFRVALVSSCEELRDVCSDIIQNSAIATYSGVISGISTSSHSSSGIGACGNTNGESTNFLVNVPACSLDIAFCGSELILQAGLGYDRYTWSGPDITVPVVTLENFYEVPNPVSGIYTVVKEDTTGSCITLTEEFIVESFGDIQNPLLDYVNGTSVISTNCSGLELPQILLCGDQTMFLETNFDPASLISISWQQLSPSGSCVQDLNDPCSLLSGACNDNNWIEEPNGNTPNYTVDIAGDYRILAEFDGGCLVPFYFTVTKNDFQPELMMQPIECGNPGQVAVTNAPPNFAFSLASGGPYTNITGIFAILPGSGGDITVYGIDTTFPGCEYTATINVPEINPVFSVEATSPTCENDTNGTGTGSILIQVTGGTPEYQYTISGGTLPSPIVVPNSSANNGNYVLESLLPGTYEVEIISNGPVPGCIYTQTVLINPAPEFIAEAILIASETCNRGALVEVRVLTGPGDYLYSDGSGNFQVDNVFEIPRPVDPNTVFTFFVADNSLPAGTPACVIEANIDNITPYEPLLIETGVTPILNGADGVIQVAATGGTPPYQYRLNDSGFTTSSVFENLSAGTYIVTIRDASGCDASQEIILLPGLEPINVTLNLENANILCFGDSTASVSSTVTGGGIGNYLYTLRGTDYLGNQVNIGPQASGAFNNLNAGNYSYEVDASSNEVETLEFSVIQSPELSVQVTSTDKSCGDGDQDGLIRVTTTGGTPPYEYTLSLSGNPLETILVNTSEFVFAGLAAGVYDVLISDTNGCSQDINVLINEPTPIALDLTVTPITNDADGIIEVNASGGIAPYTYELKETESGQVIATQSTNIFTVGTTGNYTLTVLDANNCATQQLVIVESTAQNPILDYADEIFFCAITGQVYPTIAIEDANGEAIDLPFSGVVSVVWQKLNDINCDIELQDNCPTTDSSCTSGWFNLCTTLDCDITDAGEYRVVIEFEAKSVDRIQTYYFKTEKKTPDTTQSFAMYPNPARGIVQVNKNVKNVKVFDAMGKMVLQTTQSSYDVSSLRDGIYFVEVITSSDEKIISKLIKK